MFKSLKRIAYPVADVEIARNWYSDILNSKPLFDSPIAAIFKVGDCSLSLSKSVTHAQPAEERVATYWEVDDVDAAYKRLIESGATPVTAVKDVLNIRIAQVRDPFGNILGLSGPPLNVQDRTVEQQPSETAMSAAFCRALAAKDERKEITGPDVLAALFTKDKGKELLKDSTSRKWAIDHLVSSALYGYFIARTAYFDGVFCQALAGNIPQIVFLGAGYDTRSYRFRERLGQTRIFELDIRSTQERKLSILRDAKIDIPERVSFVTINFKSDTLAAVLTKAGFDPLKRTLFIWEGVTYYLKEEAIGNTLDFIRTHSPSNSSVCFDYMTEQLESVNAAEPFLFWIDANAIAPFLTRHGFTPVEHIDSQVMEKRYLTLRDGTIAERVLSRFCFVHAAIAG
jgi:methyltransferase (TIGR00027 family)